MNRCGCVYYNPDKFPKGYVLTLSKGEKEKVIEIFDNPKLKFSPVSPKAFTEKGLYMLATILKSPRATQATIAILKNADSSNKPDEREEITCF